MEIKRPVEDEDGLGYVLAETIQRLKLAGKPTTFWLSMKAEQPAGAKPAELEAHKFFCLTALKVSSIVGHTCGVERAGKAYKLVMTSHRKRMEPMRAAKAVFVLSNYGLMHRGVDLRNSLADFSDSMLVEETVAEELQAKRLHALRSHLHD